MINSIYSLIPPLLVLLFVLSTKKVILSIGIGIISAALLINNFNLFLTTTSIIKVVIKIFYQDGSLNTSNLLLISFLFMLGILTSLIAQMGGSKAFASYAKRYINSTKKTQLMTIVLGCIIFIDDYFNALTLGEIARPLCNEYQVSKTKLAYIIDSTSAPICIISPLSSWGAYIISIFGNMSILANYTGVPIVAFLKTIPYNLYAILSILMVFASIYFNVSIGKMDTYIQENDPLILQNQHHSSPFDLLIPIISLVVVSIISIFVTGYLKGNSLNILTIMENTNTYLSLFIGAFVSIIVALLRYTNGTCKDYQKAALTGIKSMSQAVMILIFAWTLIEFISLIGTGTYLSNILIMFNFSSKFLPAILFVISSLMALATGTSWGTFGVMIPIGAQMALTIDPNLLLVCFGAVLSGSVFGDHCSPISDTTILSSTGAKCNHIDHVLTQLPYALIVAVISIIGFLIGGFSNNVFYMLSASIILLIIVTLLFQFKKTKTT